MAAKNPTPGAKTPGGWPVQWAGSPMLHTWTIPGANRRMTLRSGWVGFVIVYLVSWFNDIIERLDAPGNDPVDEGGFNRRFIGGTTTWSEHAGAIAVDLNWQKHPQHTRPEATFTRAQVKRIRAKLRWFHALALGRVFVWGGDWSPKYVDSMHFQAVPGRTRFLARILYNTPRGRRIMKANPSLARKDVTGR